eukprot:1034290-Rhodomonas_salina.1
MAEMFLAAGRHHVAPDGYLILWMSSVQYAGCWNCGVGCLPVTRRSKKRSGVGNCWRTSVMSSS